MDWTELTYDWWWLQKLMLFIPLRYAAIEASLSPVACGLEKSWTRRRSPIFFIFHLKLFQMHAMLHCFHYGMIQTADCTIGTTSHTKTSEVERVMISRRKWSGNTCKQKNTGTVVEKLWRECRTRANIFVLQLIMKVIIYWVEGLGDKCGEEEKVQLLAW